LGCYRETLAFLESIGASEHVRAGHELDVTVIDERGRRSALHCPALPPPWHLIAGLVEWEALSFRDCLSVLAIRRPIRLEQKRARGATCAVSASPGETVENWLIRNGQSERLREMLWRPLALAALNQSPSVAAAPPFVRVLAEMFGNRPSDSALVFPARPLSLMYAEPARAFIEARGGEVRTGARARVSLRGGGAEVEVQGQRLSAGAVVVAVPWFALPDVLVGDLGALQRVLQAARATGASPIVTVNLWLDGPVLDVPFVGLPGRTFQWVFDKRQLWAEPGSHLSLVSSGADPAVTVSNADLVEQATSELFDALPELRGARVVGGTVVRERRATFSLAPGEPPRPGTMTPVDGLLLAGDWIDTGLPGTIESAVVSGHAAARAALGQA